MDIKEAINYLYRLRNRGSKYGIERMQLLVEALGHPERDFPIIHVAGTNGKGSVCAMLESIFRAAGYRTGLFTSPHLVHLGERVQINRQPLGEARIVELTQEIAEIGAVVAQKDPDLHPTFFEFLTAMAFLEFQRAQVDIAILETGLGGRLDSTNVVTPEVSLITSIGFDHMEQLGTTLTAIAGEKAGIIKSSVPVVCGRLPDEALEVIETVARGKNAPLHLVSNAFDSESTLPETSLAGEVQRWNAGVATITARLLHERFNLSEETIRKGLSNVNWAGRWETTQHGGRKIIFDATHNAESAEVLDKHLVGLCATGIRPDFVVGILGNQRAAAILPIVAKYATAIYLVAPDQPRALPPEGLKHYLPKTFPGTCQCTTLAELFAADSPLLGTQPKPLVITGSLYLLGEVKTLLSKTTAPLSIQDRP